jgi:hypothetical protein
VLVDHLDEGQARESQFLATAVDPLVREIVYAVEPRDAYRVANGIPGCLVDALDWLPHGGGLYTAWQELLDLFETGKTPIPDADAALRQAATEWLARQGNPTAASIEAWLERTQTSIKKLLDRDGTFWSPND